MNKLKVTIAGPTGTGKTTVARLLRDTLMRMGMTSEVYDFDSKPEPEQLGTRLADRAESLGAMKKMGIEVIIETVSTGSEPVRIGD